MAMIQFDANPAKPTRDGHFQVVFHLDGRGDPFPRRVVEVKTTAEALAALGAYKSDAAATGLPLAVTMRVAKASRAPNGFKKATEAMPFYHRVNI